MMGRDNHAGSSSSAATPVTTWWWRCRPIAAGGGAVVLGAAQFTDVAAGQPVHAAVGGSGQGAGNGGGGAQIGEFRGWRPQWRRGSCALPRCPGAARRAVARPGASWYSEPVLYQPAERSTLWPTAGRLVSC